MSDRPVPIEFVEVNGQTCLPAFKVAELVGVTRSTFASYVTRGQAPAAAYDLGATRLWDAEEVRHWISNRPGSPGRPSGGQA